MESFKHYEEMLNVKCECWFHATGELSPSHGYTQQLNIHVYDDIFGY